MAVYTWTASECIDLFTLTMEGKRYPFTANPSMTVMNEFDCHAGGSKHSHRPVESYERISLGSCAYPRPL
jgi:hypothetical protein